MSFLQFFYVGKGLSLNFNRPTIEAKRLARISRSGMVKDSGGAKAISSYIRSEKTKDSGAKVIRSYIRSEKDRR